MDRLRDLLDLSAQTVEPIALEPPNLLLDAAELQQGGRERLTGLIMQLVRQAQSLLLLRIDQTTMQTGDQPRFSLNFRCETGVGRIQGSHQAIALRKHGGDRKGPERGRGQEDLQRQYPLRRRRLEDRSADSLDDE